MKRLGLLIVVVAVLLSGGAAWADEVYVIAGGRGVGTRITSLPCEIKNPGFYYLASSLTYSGDSNAITVNANDVTLDLMGFSLSKSGAPGGTTGISINGHTNVEIRNGTVRGFWIGILEAVSSGNQHRAINIRATDNYYGIWFYGSNHLIQSCNGSNNGATGLGLNSGVITGCVASNNTYGFVLYKAGNVLSNSAYNNSSHNFFFGEGVPTAILVDRNSAFGLATNYYVVGGTTVVQMGTNAGTP